MALVIAGAVTLPVILGAVLYQRYLDKKQRIPKGAK